MEPLVLVRKKGKGKGKGEEGGVLSIAFISLSFFSQELREVVINIESISQPPTKV